jgi:aminobenzoyl-glutamate transport protein
MSQADAPGFLGWVERTGNRLPDPVVLFVWLIGALVALSVVASVVGLSAVHPSEVDAAGQPKLIEVASLLSGANLTKLWVDMPTTFTHFHPLGYVLVVMLGAGVAEQTGLFSAAMRAAVKRAPVSLLTPVVALVAMVANHAADAAYVVLIPVSAVLFASAGRHPLAGIVTAFAGVSGGFSANLMPGQLDALLFGITEAAVKSSGLHPGWSANIAGNAYFIQGMTVTFLPVIWYVTDRIIEPRLGTWTPADAPEEGAPPLDAQHELNAEERRGLRNALLAMLVVVALWVFMTVGPGTPLIDEGLCPPEKAAVGACSFQTTLGPLYKSLVGAFFLLFLATGYAYGAATGSIRTHRDLVRMMTHAMSTLSYYLVLSFVAAHFVAMFNWSNLGLILAVHGADAIRSSNLPLPILLGLIVGFAAFVNLFIGSASAKWALLAPVLVPMLMLLGVSPEATTAAYRVGDSATNIVTPLMVYFPLVLTFAQRWQRDFGLGSLTALMIPYSVGILIVGLLLTIGWVALELPLGPGAEVSYSLPSP